jgi:prefoldin subunit 5
MAARSNETEVLAQELEHIGHKIESLEARINEVEGVIPRLETAAETTGSRSRRGLGPLGRGV